jgi:hypothetical protein
MNSVDNAVSLDNLAAILDPYLASLALISNGELKERIIDQIFNPLLENNKTIQEVSEDEEEMARKEKHHRLVDGGKLPPKTVKEINAMLNEKYMFSGFNILIYAQNFVLKLASTTDKLKVNEDNRDQLYKLYDYALQLEPKPEREEPTYSQL